MKKTVLSLSAGLLALGVSAAAIAQQVTLKPEEQIEYRQAAYNFASWNMKKLKAHNRTEVAFLTRSMFGVPQTRSVLGVPQTRSAPDVQQTRSALDVQQNGQVHQDADHGQTAGGE